MFELDESFLDEVGLTNMPEEQKGDFLAYADEQLAIRLGEKISAGVDENLLEDLDRIIDGDGTIISRYLPEGYEQDDTYRMIKENLSGDSNVAEAAVLSQYATSQWLNMYCPNYAQLAQEAINSLRDEISAGRDAILASLAA